MPYINGFTHAEGCNTSFLTNISLAECSKHHDKLIILPVHHIFKMVVTSKITPQKPVIWIQDNSVNDNCYHYTIYVWDFFIYGKWVMV